MTEPIKPTNPRSAIALPEDKPIQLFVLSMAANSIMYRIFTPERYKNEVLSQEVTGLSKLSRDIEAGYNRRLAAEKRLIGRMTEIGGERILKRPPNWLTITLVLFVAVGIIAYGNYSGQIYVWEAGLTLYQGYIVVAFLLLLAFFLLFRYGVRRRRRPS